MRDAVFTTSLRATAGLSAALVVLIGVFLLMASWPALQQVGVLRWLTDDSWQPLSGQFLLWPMIAGSLLAALGAVLLALPLGLCSAVFCNFYAAPAVARPWRRTVELMAGIPSVVYGFWGLVVLVPWVRAVAPPGPSLLAATLVLALMILPTLAVSADAALAAVSGSLRQAGQALGLGRVSQITRIALPAARAGIVTGVLLSVARALGETMAVLMVAGNVVQVPSSVFEPVRVLTANIALEMAYAVGHHRSALFVSGLVLFALTVLLVLLAEWISRGRRPHVPV
ncbi:phosphate ABC transporter permease subunit PstC [Polycyclovorans algicola]|uniref:phosphate ABC transporter permease subunit PstC n=1 Tax=Polycyclovorans algicola TaxID=616992 RepID=UPI0005BA016B|nr:phosphate ABC transporter permease subunit PstC [Polycyclovorans algicola]